MSVSTASLREQIELEIRERGPMPFSRYMELCLYDPLRGYYSRNAEQFGKAGDFYTSSDVHAVFGRLMAKQFEEIWRVLDRPPKLEIVELGPGRGLFARDVLDWSNKKFPDSFAALTYILHETSPALRKKSEENLRNHIASGKAQIRSAFPQEIRSEHPQESSRQLPQKSSSEIPQKVSSEVPQEITSEVPEERPTLAQRGGAGTTASGVKVPEGRSTAASPNGVVIPRVVFANEFFDAHPIEILTTKGKLHIACEHDGLCEIWLKPHSAELEFLDRYGVQPENAERIEVPIIAQNMMKQIAGEIDRGVIIAIDYGYTRNQQLAGLHRGTLMTYRHHSASADPYQAPGEQDITSHVNFTALAAACEKSGLKCEKLLTQSQFLMGIGQNDEFADVFEDCRVPQEKAKVALQLKHLITPEGMGENFKVLFASKGIRPEKIASLGGLYFAIG